MESDKNQWSLSRKQKTGGAAFKTSVSEEQDMASSTGKSLQLQRPASPAESFLSMKSDRSKEDPLNFSSQVLSSLALQRLASPAESFLSMKSDRSDEEPLNLSDEVLRSLQLQRPASPAESFLSMKSDRSKEDPLNFSDQVLRSLQLQRPASPAESFLSMKSDRSKEDPLNFSSQVLRSLQLQRPASPAESFLSMKRDRPKEDPLNFSNQVLSTREHQGADSSATSHDFMESNRSSDQPSGFSNEGQSSRKPTPVSTHNSKLTKKEKDAIKKMKHKLKSTICTKYEQQSKQETDTELCVQAEDKEELVQTNYDDMFKVRTVLTTGVAGVGKTFQTSMFMLNWAKEKTCKEIDLVVSLHFSELNKGDVQSLEDLLNDHFGDVKQQLVPSYDEFKVLFILDGLEQCKFELDFKNNKDLSDIKIKASMDELLTNLIKGTLLPSAHLWIISQPSGIDKIPPKYIQKVTKCQETSNRRKKLVTHLRQRILRGNSQHEATKHPNQKDTEHIMREDSTAEVTDEQKKKQTVVKVKATSDIFKDGNGEKIRTVLTVGEAGIGKSFHVQKFIKEWAENKKRSLLSKLGFGKASNNELIIFPLDVCELNKIKDQEFSLVGLLKHFFKETKEFVITDFSQFRVLFVLDGVEKFESQLDFDIKNPVTDVSESASVDVLLTNLIKGNLLPLAQVWITSRPSAVNWLNADKLVYRRTEIREKDINKKMKDNLKTRISKKYGKQSEQETDTELCIQAKGKEELMKTNYDDMFKVRTVLTTGVAGVGKTFQTRMFMLNWAKEKTCKEIDLVVSLHFSELNKYKGNVQSLEDLLNDHFRAVKKHGVLSYDEFKVLFILDGLEQCKFELDFTNSKDLSNMKKPADLSDETNSPILNHTNDMNNSPDLRFTGDVNQSQDSGDMHNSPDLSVTNKSADLSDMKKKASMDELLTNLIKGTLLPSAHLWIISQPSGVDKIPADYIQKVTKCQETSKRWKKLVTHLRERLLSENSQPEDINHPNQKNTEHIMREDSTAEDTDEQKKKQTVVKVKATSDIFKDGNGEKIRTVLTVGEAGIGKSFHVQKFMKAWAENTNPSLLTWVTEKAKHLFGQVSDNELIIFPLSVCELNKIKHKEFSLVGLLNHFFKETKEFVITDFSQFTVLFVLDGVGKFESQLDFDIKNPVTDVRKSASVDVLLTNLIKGNLLPSARVWITSRPSAVNWLNVDKLVYRRTEIREKSDKEKLKTYLKTRICTKYGKQSKQETDTELCVQAEDKEELVQTNYDDMFKVRTVLTTGVAGVGKTFQTSMFMLNWAKEKTCKEIDLVVSLHFSELNKGDVQSLEDLLNDHFSDVKQQLVPSFDEFILLFILDGLEQCKFELDFKNNKDLSDIKEKASMDELLTNLIKGTLLPSAHLWIISQPSGIDKIPPDYIQKVTKCQETSERRKKLVTHLRERLLRENSQPEDINHPNHKNIEYIMREDSTAEVTDEQKKKQTVVKVKATSDIFKDGNGEKIRTVLTVGEAGIGKSFHVQKFMKEWAENTNPARFTWVTEKAKGPFGKASDNELVIFPLDVCELNKIKDQEFSLVGLLNHFFKETKEFVITDFSQFRVLFVLDGIEKFESQLDFDIKNPVTDVRKSASVDVLLRNLIKGNLLPSAQVWITSRPSAVNWLNFDKLVYRRTEIREEDADKKMKRNLKMIICTKYEEQSKQETDTELCVQGEDKEELVQTNYDDMFKVRTVLTTGVAGVGKTFQSSMFMYNWAKEKTCKEIDLVVSLHFSELNKGDIQSLEDLLNDHFRAVKKHGVLSYDEFKVLFVLDGLEQCKFELDFTNSKDLGDMKKPADLSDETNSLILNHTNDMNNSSDLSDAGDMDQLQDSDDVNNSPDLSDAGDMDQLQDSGDMHNSPDLSDAGDMDRLQDSGDMHNSPDLSDAGDMDQLQDSDDVNNSPDLSVTNESADLTDINKKASMDELLTNLIKGTLLPSAHLWIISQPSGIDKIPTDYIQKVTKCQETSERWKKLVTHLHERLLRENSQPEDINHPNQKNTEHIIREGSTAEDTDEQKKKQTVVKVKATSDIFKDGNGEKIRTVLTVGEADIGKSFHVQKFMKEWAENTNPSLLTWVTEKAKGSFGQVNDNELIIFPFSIFKLNLIKDQEFTLVGLLNHLFKENKEFVITRFSQFTVLFVLDGIEKFESPLDFDIKNPVTDVSESASVDVLLRNLIKGNLLPSAQVWITSRPSAVNWLNADKLVYRRTEIREKPDITSHRNLKSHLKDQFTCVSEGIDRQKASAVLNEIYTELYIIEGQSEEVNDQQETRQIQNAKFKPVREETAIKYNKIFTSVENKPIKTVMTLGVAGIGKTITSMKYMLDWADGKDIQNIYYMFPLPFRELNLRREEQQSFEELLHQFFPAMRTSEISDYNKYHILIVLDGFDECRLDLDFGESNKCIDVKESTSVNVLLTNLIQGNLLPKAQIWITSRPAASNRIPADKVDRVTEVRGFNDEQKEEYFRKRLNDKNLAENILSHVKKSRSLYIMCHIPVFCWITSKVLEDYVTTNQEDEMPKTLTDMYTYFLLLECRQANRKYSEDETREHCETDECWNERNKETVISLGKLAFEELVKGNFLFTEENLTQCGTNETNAAVFSGIFTQIKRESTSLYQQKLFCFVHLSIQEFLAAFYVFNIFNNKGENLLTTPPSVVSDLPASDFYKKAVDKALDSKHGDWDLFLRFLLGLSLETNQEHLKELLKDNRKINKETNKETAEYIKKKINEDISDADKNLNLLYCLNELNDHSLVKDIKKQLRSGKQNFEDYSAGQWSALTFVLLTSDENLDVFDLKKYRKSEKVLLGMLPVVKVSKCALLSWCELSEQSCSGLTSSVLSSAFSNLSELDFSHNDLLDSGVQHLAEGLKSPHCKLEILKLSGCQVTEKGCSSLALSLESNTASLLKHLDLSYNHPGDSGTRRLTDIVESPNMKLKKLLLDHAGEHRLKPGIKKYGVELKLDETTAGKRLLLLEGNRKARTAKKVEEKPARPECEDRFKRSQVFCDEGLKGVCYWEVDWRGTVSIAAAYKRVGRKWDSSGGLGCNEISWGLYCSGTKCTAMHGKTSKPLEIPTSPKIAVLLDWEGGTLSYYSVSSEKLSLIHTFHAKFREPLFPAFWFKTGSVTLCDLD